MPVQPTEHGFVYAGQAKASRLAAFPGCPCLTRLATKPSFPGLRPKHFQNILGKLPSPPLPIPLSLFSPHCHCPTVPSSTRLRELAAVSHVLMWTHKDMMGPHILESGCVHVASVSSGQTSPWRKVGEEWGLDCPPLNPAPSTL